MVLRVNNTKRIVSNAENTPPSLASLKISHVRRTITDAASRRRARATGSSRKPENAVVAAAARRKQLAKKRDVPMIHVKVQTFANPDVEMADASPPAPTMKTTQVSLPRHLPKVDSPEVSHESISAVAPELAGADLQFIRDMLPEFGASMLRVLASVKTQLAKNVLPHEVQVIVNDLTTSDPPTHMLGIHADKKAGSKTSVTLFAAHSIVFAANCSKLPQFASSSSSSELSSNMTLPIHYVQLPFPKSFPCIHRYLYTKDVNILTGVAFLPTIIPDELRRNSRDRTAILKVATELARTFTPHVLVDWTRPTYQTWANMTRLGIQDELMWDAMEMNWEILLNAIAIGTGVQLPKEEEEEQQ